MTYGRYIGMPTEIFALVGASRRQTHFNCLVILIIMVNILCAGETDRNRDEEILNLLKADTIDETDPTKLW